MDDNHAGPRPCTFGKREVYTNPTGFRPDAYVCHFVSIAPSAEYGSFDSDQSICVGRGLH